MLREIFVRSIASVTGVRPERTSSIIKSRRLAMSSCSVLASDLGVPLGRRFLRLSDFEVRRLGLVAEAGWLFGVVMVFARYVDRLGFFFADAHPHAAVRCRDAQVAVTKPAHQVKGLPGCLHLRKTHRVVFDRRFHRRAHLRGRLEKSVGRHEAIDALMRALEVVGVDEKLESTVEVAEVGKHRLGQKLVPKRLPKPLDLPERHRVLRATFDVLDAFSP